MDTVIGARKTFSKILVAMDELKKSTATEGAVDYAINIARDYDAQLIILHVIRADAKLHGINPPSHIIEMRKQAQAHFAKITEKIHENSNNKENTPVRISSKMCYLVVLHQI